MEKALEEGAVPPLEESAVVGAIEGAPITITQDDAGLVVSAASDKHVSPLYRRRKVWVWTGVGVALTATLIGLSVGLTGRRSRKDLDSAPTFLVELDTFGEQVLSPYERCSDLEQDLLEAAKYLSNAKIDSDARAYYHSDYRQGDCLDCSFGGGFARGPVPMPAADEASTTTATSGQASSTPATPTKTEGESSFGTNNQVDGVDEADVVKATENWVFAAYGQEILILNSRNVTLEQRVPIPQPDVDVVIETAVKDGYELPEGVSSMLKEFSDCSSNRILDMLLHGEERLTVIATGYCYFWGPLYELDQNRGVLSDKNATRIFSFAINPFDGSLSLLDSSSIHGYYLSSRSIGQNAHVVTTSYVNAYPKLTQYLDRWSADSYHGLLENEYRTAAHKKAEEHLETFARAIVHDLVGATHTADESTCSSLLKLALLQSSDDDDGIGSIGAQQLDFTGNGIVRAMTLLTSFNMAFEDSLVFNDSAVFLPTAGSTIYSSSERLIVAGQGWHRDREQNWHEETFLIGYQLDGTSSKAVSFGRAPGTVLNQFALDHAKHGESDYLRIATTTSAKWGLLPGKDRVWGQVVESTSQVTVLQFPAEHEDEDQTSNRFMKKVGQVRDIGRTERIYAVRFIGDKGYVVTFRQTDPFYTLDLSVPEAPRLVGELKIPGFSNQLQPVGNELILGVGQHADDNGVAQGLLLSLFDVSNFAQPRRIQHHVMKDSFSRSSAQYEHKALRYLNESQALIIPVEAGTFDGFIVFDIDVDGIKEHFRIKHADQNGIRYGCWSSENLEPRSVVYDGDIMSFKGHSIMSHNLITREKEASIDLDEGHTDKECYHYYLY